MHQARRTKSKLNVHSSLSKEKYLKNVVCIDIETTGLDPEKDELIEIAAVRRNKTGEIIKFQRYIKIDQIVSSKISQLTGITNEILNKSGSNLDNALTDLEEFIGDNLIMGYNIRFDLEFLRFGFIKMGKKMFNNKSRDLLRLIKRKNKFMSNYHLNSVLDKYNIINENPHTAAGDARATFLLGEKLYEEGILKI
ncbi:PolC-type DNA polymerase III [Lactobacillus sp. PV012]|uniref:3'-5' exonuclease n=1 Tax=Lactobacillus sp. PV012 TaxID=2594494 RepID=UPI0022401D0C|nr:3'-5' exonuclease [Lactobacillus sp. PV012]